MNYLSSTMNSKEFKESFTLSHELRCQIINILLTFNHRLTNETYEVLDDVPVKARLIQLLARLGKFLCF